MAFLRSIWESRILTSWVSLFLRGGTVFFLLPVVALQFDGSIVSLWLLFFSFVTLGMVFDFGFTPTFVRLLSYARVDKEKLASGPREPSDLDFAELLFVLSKLYTWLPFVVTVLIGGLGSLALIKPIAESNLGLVAWASWSLVLFSIGISLWGQMHAAYLQGIDRIAHFRRNEVIGFSLSILSSYTALIFFNTNFITVVLLTQIGPIINTALHFYASKKAGFFHQKGMGAPKKLVWRVWGDVWRMGVGSVAMAGSYQGVGIVLSQILSPGALATFLLGHRLVQTVSVFSNIPFYSYIPQMAAVARLGNQSEFEEQIRMRVPLTLLCVVAGLTFLGHLGPKLFAVFTPDILFPGRNLWVLLCCLAIVDRLAGLVGQVNLVSGRIIIHIANSLSAVGMFALLIPFVLLWDMEGAVMAMVLSVLILNVPYAFYTLIKCQGYKMAIFFIKYVFCYSVLLLVALYFPRHLLT